MSRHSARALAVMLAAVLAAVSPMRQIQAQTPAKPVIIAYVFPRNDLIVPAEIAADKLTHINYAFADVKDGRVVEGFARDAENFKLLGDLRRTHPHLRILISVGGWTWSGNFSDAALTAESRRRFVESAIAFVSRHNLECGARRATSSPCAFHGEIPMSAQAGCLHRAPARRSRALQTRVATRR